jgi:hypothetical protein
MVELFVRMGYRRAAVTRAVAEVPWPPGLNAVLDWFKVP